MHLVTRFDFDHSHFYSSHGHMKTNVEHNKILKHEYCITHTRGISKSFVPKLN